MASDPLVRSTSQCVWVDCFFYGFYMEREKLGQFCARMPTNSSSDTAQYAPKKRHTTRIRSFKSAADSLDALETQQPHVAARDIEIDNMERNESSFVTLLRLLVDIPSCMKRAGRIITYYTFS